MSYERTNESAVQREKAKKITQENRVRMQEIRETILESWDTHLALPMIEKKEKNKNS